MTSINSSLKNHKQLTIFHYLAEHFIIEVYICWPYVCHYTPAPPEGGYTVLPLSFRPCKIFFVAFFSATIDAKNLIFGHKLHIGMYISNYLYLIWTSMGIYLPTLKQTNLKSTENEMNCELMLTYDTPTYMFQYTYKFVLGV
jgi:hypothetical protein